jgi:Zn-dependent protease with chaperone function
MRARASSEYLITAEDIAPGWVLLYAITLAIQTLCASARGVVAYVLLLPLHLFFSEPRSMLHLLALALAYGPLALSFLTLMLPLGGGLWKAQSGGREPSRRERLLFDDALSVLKQADSRLRAPRRWFVIDEPDPNAAAYADTLMVTRGLLESGYVEAVIAHELGHLNSSDSRLTAALLRLTTPPRAPLPFPLRTIGFVASGALGAWIMRVPWAAYWRAREFQADAYVARLGQAEALAAFLERYALHDDLPVPFPWLSRGSHPPTEHRVDRLYQHTDEGGSDGPDARGGG